MDAPGPNEASWMKSMLDWAWAAVGVLVGVIWRKHNEDIVDLKTTVNAVKEKVTKLAKEFDDRVEQVERRSVPLDSYEQNRKEVREVQMAIFNRLDSLGQSMARIEGKLDK